jgi:GT2 family glycosyltransferase
MKIAAITITYNDDYKFTEWYNYYREYQDELFLHIIVDNFSNKNYLAKVKESFTNSYIIERTSNGGCVGAYNDGIKYALSIPEVEAIMLIGNDIKLKSGAIALLSEFLFSDSNLGMVSPILLEKNSYNIEDFGCKISSTLMMIEYGQGLILNDIKTKINYCEALPGGMNLSKRIFYEKVGLQDENLFMYSDEVDMGLRAKKNGFLLASYSEAISWHCHINKDNNLNRRDPFTKYLAGRNKVYLAKKHFGILKVIYVFIFYVFGSSYKILINLIKGKFYKIKEYSLLVLGAIMGLFGNMKPNVFSAPKNDF